MHELPQLGRLEQKYSAQLTVIGVQSPKYPAEGTGDSLLRAVERYDISHPVINDPDFRVWNDYAVKAWPTLVFVSPTGSVIGSHAGETSFEALDRVVGRAVAEYEREGSLAPRPGPHGRPFARSDRELAFPGQVLVEEERLFVADSGHHRILVCTLDGEVESVFGLGQRGLIDGDRSEVRFNNPQGLALDRSRNTLYVADAENHAVRAINLTSGQVSTVAGTGEQARRVVREGPARSTALSSPWDLVLRDQVLYIAMAGLHQVWSLNLTLRTVAAWAGTGHEGVRDGNRGAAWLAQPMGLTADEQGLFVASAEAQTVQAVNWVDEEVHTLVGQGLFDFGDVDGVGTVAALQHPQGIAYWNDGLFVTDTYNHKVKRLHLANRTIKTVAGSGQAGTLDGPGAFARFNEPTGVCAAGDDLYIADTNNHLIRRLDLESGHLHTLHIRWPSR